MSVNKTAGADGNEGEAEALGGERIRRVLPLISSPSCLLRVPTTTCYSFEGENGDATGAYNLRSF